VDRNFIYHFLDLRDVINPSEGDATLSELFIQYDDWKKEKTLESWWSGQNLKIE
jgi:hypothetical protein